MNKREAGEILEPVLILIGLLIVIFIFVLPAGPGTAEKEGSSERSIWDNNSTNENETSYGLPKDSLYERKVKLGTGNARSETDAVEEYITISNREDLPITITGWFLTNAKGTKPYTLNGHITYVPSDQAVIPQGTTYLTGNGQNILTPIILKADEEAIITTGSIGPRSDIPIVSFKINKCSGYLSKEAEYDFIPSIRKNCVRPNEEPGFQYLDEECQEFIEGMSTCHIPDFETRDIYGKSCRNCVDGKPGLSRSCIAFLKAHYSYSGCLVYHGSDSDFLLKEWRVFLDQRWEMWAEKKETISLFDQLGKLVDYLSY